MEGKTVSRSISVVLIDILNLPGWQVMGCEAGEERYVIQAAPASPVSACSACGCLAVVKHGTDAQVLRDFPCHGKYVLIQVDRQRFRCKHCQKTWFEPLPGVDERRQATSRLVCYIQQQALKRTFVALALEVGMDEKSIRNIFHDHVAELEQARHVETPAILGIDELHLLGQPRGMLTDLEAKTVLEVLPDRKKLTVAHYLGHLPNKERVQVAVIDMWRPYWEALQEQLPQAAIVIDKFHVLKMLSQAVEAVRKDIRNSLSDRQRRTLMHDRFLLLKRPRSLNEQDKLILESWLGTFPRLKAVYERKEEFYGIYDASTQEEAFSSYFAWLEHVAQDGVMDAFLDLALAIEHWGDGIFAYFQHRYTGGFVEAANGLGRVIDRQGRGYSFEVLRARLLYGPQGKPRTK